MGGERHICCATVTHGKGWNRSEVACGRAASVERDDKWYCKLHDPVRRAERKAKRKAEWNARMTEERARYRIQAAAPEMLAALQAVLVCPDHDKIPQDILVQLRAAVDAATARDTDEDWQ